MKQYRFLFLFFLLLTLLSMCYNVKQFQAIKLLQRYKNAKAEYTLLRIDSIKNELRSGPRRDYKYLYTPKAYAIAEKDVVYKREIDLSYLKETVDTSTQIIISKQMAARIADAIWYSEYKEKIFRCRPYYVSKYNGIWFIRTSAPIENYGHLHLYLNAKDGRIIRYFRFTD